MTDDASDSDAPGWDAIDATFAALYPDQPNPPHAASQLPPFLGGDPLQGVSLYRATKGRPHWHLVTYGFSDLYEKDEDADPAISGFGFELTFRLAVAATDEPPTWAVDFLQNLARYVFKSGNGLADGEYIDLNGPICVGAAADITCAIFVTDPEAGRIDTPNGRLGFLQVVGITKDELQAAQRWKTTGIADLLRERDPLLITDLARPSLLDDQEARARIDEGSASDGSSCGLLFVDTVEIESVADGTCLTLGATGLASMIGILPLRHSFGLGLVVSGTTGRVSFEKGDASGIVRMDEHGLAVALTAEAVRDLVATLRIKAGEYRIAALPDLTIRVVPGQIRDRDGTVIETIG